MTRYPRRIRPYGPYALLLEWEQRMDPAISRSVHHYAREARKISGVTECVPAYASLLVRFRTERLTAYQLRERIYQIPVTPGSGGGGTDHLLPVCYDEAMAPDLTAVLETLHLRPRQLIDLHTGTDYLVYQVGYLPGFAFLGQTDPALEIPRRSTPRARVPVGSVGLADRQTGVYPSESPGGWQLIGRCPVSPVLEAGDRVRFTAIDTDVFYQLEENPDAWPAA